jgi:hypothetical protein
MKCANICATNDEEMMETSKMAARLLALAAASACLPGQAAELGLARIFDVKWVV